MLVLLVKHPGPDAGDVKAAADVLYDTISSIRGQAVSEQPATVRLLHGKIG